MAGGPEKPREALIHIERSVPHIQKRLKDIVRAFTIVDTAAVKKHPALLAEPDFEGYVSVIEEGVKPLFRSAIETKIDFGKILWSDNPKREAIVQGWQGNYEKYGGFEDAYFAAREFIKQQRAFPRLKVNYENVMNDAVEELRDRLANALEAWASSLH